MHRPKQVVFSLICTLILFSSSNAINSRAGSTGAVFLKLGVGARAVAMGGAFCAIADDVNTIYWNPAGLGQLKEGEVTFTHNEWLEDLRYEFVGCALPVGSKGAFGGSMIYLGMEKIEGFDAYDFKTGDFTAYDGALTLSYGHKVKERVFIGGSENILSIGASIKIIQQKIEDKTATGFALDLGMLYGITRNLTLGLNLQNIGPEIKFIERGSPLPLNLKLGLAYRFLDDKSILAIDIDIPIDNDIRSHLGTEYWLTNALALRAGYEPNKDIGSGYTVGFGLKFKRHQFDYAYVPYGDLGDTHRISFTTGF